MLFFSAHSRFLARLLFANAIRHGANPLTFGALLCHFNSAHFRSVSILFYSSASQCVTVSMPHLALLLHRGAALLRNVSTLIFANAALSVAVPLLFRAPFRALISHDPIPKVFFKSLFIESILSRLLKKTIEFSSSGCSFAYPGRVHMVGYQYAVLTPIARGSAFVFRSITGYH